MNFKQLRDLVVKGYIPKICARAKLVKFPACQKGKTTMSGTNTSNKIIRDLIIKHSGDLVNMDQVESSTPGRPFTYSGRNNKQIVCHFTLCRQYF